MSTQGPVLILGAASDIGRAIAVEYAKAGNPLRLAARDSGRLAADAADLSIRYGARVSLVECDVLEVDPSAFFDGFAELPEIVVCVVGLLGDQSRAQADPAAARHVIETNFVRPAAFLGEVANRMAQRGSGVIVGVSSVAGDRGRASNYVYGAAKAGLTAFLSGLRNRLASTGVRVVTVKPGFVRTQMTAGMKLPAVLTAEPAEVARAIVAASRGGAEVIYVRPTWRVIMAVIQLLPEPLFKRLAL